MTAIEIRLWREPIDVLDPKFYEIGQNVGAYGHAPLLGIRSGLSGLGDGSHDE